MTSIEKFEFSETNSSSNNLRLIIEENVNYIVPILFYICGLFCASFTYKSIKIDGLKDLLKGVFVKNSVDLFNVFAEQLSVYLIVFTFTILIGLCVIGFPIINCLPLLFGFVIGIKVSLYYNLYNFKGVGYSLLMIIPEFAFVVVVLIFTIEKARGLSKLIYDKTKNKTNEELNSSSFLKSFLFYLMLIIMICGVNSLLVYLFGTIVKL